ncbi:hypothetical protein B0A49_05008 [Cryomyces minteri]|uniref:BTB domain-containing protein n=1 Tax=Cryomyces minteri TaxID=331657 RepID=A0A4U0XB25_9PEZI|nr:hypothetical protein B0A49_05008 [Cryomyces minteri]
MACAGATYRVHEAIICPRSEFFAAACRKLSRGRSTLSVIHSEAVATTIHYFYHLDYAEKVPKLSKPCRHYLEFPDQLRSLSSSLRNNSPLNWNDAELIPALHVAYQNTPEDEKFLRRAAADALNAHPELLGKPEVQAAMYEVNLLSYELLERSMKRMKELMEEQLGY